MPVHVTSDIGRLRSVLVHTPGPELLAVTPDTRDDYLYDDIIAVEMRVAHTAASWRSWSDAPRCMSRATW